MAYAETNTSSPKYNGWTNYETWNVNLWIDNEEGSSNYWRDQAQSAWDNAEAERSFSRAERATLDLSDTLKDEFSEASQDVLGEHHQASMWADLLGAALSEVNWHEIAEHMIEETDQDENCDECSEAAPEHAPDCSKTADENYSCNQCQALMINGVYCHETGCANIRKVKVDGEWVTSDNDEG